MDEHGLTIHCPPEAPASGPVAVTVTMRADMRTYWDNNGIIDKALTVAMVRRDRPGLRFLAKIDPKAIMLPDAPLIGRPSDAELDAAPATITEVKTLDGAASLSAEQGAADYFVTAAFSRWWGGLKLIRITAQDDRLEPPTTLEPGPTGQPWSMRKGTDPAAVLQLEGLGRGCRLVVPVSAGTLARSGSESVDWLTVVGFKLGTTGGACGGLYGLPVERKAAADRMEVLIPLAALAPMPDVGRWLFLAFIRCDMLPPQEILIANAHLP